MTELGNHKRLICLTHVHILCVPNVQVQCIDFFLSTMFSMSDILILHYYITGRDIPPGALSPPIVSGISVALSLVFCVVFWRWLFVLLSFFAWPLCCLSFDLRILITHLVSSNSSYPHVLILVLISFLNVIFSSSDILIPHVQINYSISRVHVCFRRVTGLYFVFHTWIIHWMFSCRTLIVFIYLLRIIYSKHWLLK